MKNSSSKISTFGTINAKEFTNKNYNITYSDGAIQITNKRHSPIALCSFIILLCFLLAIPVTKTVKYPYFDVTIENLSSTPYFQSYIEDIPNEPIPQFTELLDKVGGFSGNVKITPWIDAVNADIIHSDWGSFNWAKNVVEFIVYPFVWIYNLWSSAFELLLLFI